MWWRACLVGVVMAAGCTKPNPRSCNDGICNDPQFPFCDVEGALGGEPKECIAVSCEPMQFESCRGDHELRCNANGNNYESTQCELGCSAATDGCRLCEPNQTTCTNGKVATCDENGAVVAMESCPLGCFEDQPRCRDIDPSNGFGSYLDMVQEPQDLDLMGATIFTETGDVMVQGAPVPNITSFLAPAPNGGPPVRVIVARDVRLRDVVAKANMYDVDPGFTSGPALAIVAAGTITVEGRVKLGGGAGGLATTGCAGERAIPDIDQQELYPGSGGGGHATAGAKGGDIMDRYPGGTGGTIAGTESLVPLRGGCPSGGTTSLYGAGGGGAVQLTSQQAITISGIIDVRGTTPEAVYGGGAGGGVLLEAPKVTLTSAARIIATGGGGGSGPAANHTFPVSTDDGTPELGVACAPTTIYCTTGGNGAAPGVPATAGTTAAGNTTPPVIGAGGGGGGLGRIRINTPDRTYTKSSGAIEAGSLSTGVLSTR